MGKQAENFIVRKNASFFLKLDFDRDGMVEKSDVTLGAQRVARELGHAAGSPGEKRVLDALERSPHAANTYVVFAADSGVARGSHGLIGKQNLYEHSMRAPAILAGPGVPACTARSSAIA